MRNDSTVFVGLDVHQKSIVAAYAVDAAEPEDLGNIGILQRDLDRLCQRMRSKAATVRFVYEAGPCGYAVYRYLTGKGFDCTVCAPSLIARKPGDRVKTDQRDARKLVRALRMNDLSAVHVPDAADEAFRDLVRVWSAARVDLAKAKQRLKSFLLVHDVRYTGKANWGSAHRHWLSRFVFKQMNSQLAFQEHLHAIEDRLSQCERVEKLLREAAPQLALLSCHPRPAGTAWRSVQSRGRPHRRDRRDLPLRFGPATDGLARHDPERTLHRRTSSPGRHHQVRQCQRTTAARRSRLGLPLSAEGESVDPATP